MFRLSERLFVIALVLISMHVVSGITNTAVKETDNAIVSTELHPYEDISQIGLYVWCATLILRRRRKTLPAIRAAWPFMLLTVLSIVSMAWSVNPVMTLRRAGFLLLSTLTAVYLGERYTVDEFAQLLADSLIIIMLASIVAFFVAPQIALDPSHIGQWRGIVGHKNSFGESMGIAVVLMSLVRFRRNRWAQPFFFCMAFVLLLLSHSATAAGVAVIVLCSSPFWGVARLKVNQRVIAYTVCTILAVAVAVFIYLRSDLFLALLGKDSTLTGRSDLWRLVMNAISKRPFLGYGYEAFWEGYKGESRAIILESGWLVPMAHNGYLELGLSLGLAGFAAFLFASFKYVQLAMEYIRYERRPIAYWPMAYFCFFTIHNLAESTLLTRTTFQFLFFVVIATSLQQGRQRRMQEGYALAEHSRHLKFENTGNAVAAFSAGSTSA